MRRWFFTLLMILFPVSLFAEASPQDTTAWVTAIVDGDTVWVLEVIWRSPLVAQPLFLVTPVKVRLAGIDAPELAGQCPAETKLGKQASDAMRELIPPGTEVILRNVKADKYHQRVVADIVSPNNVDIGGEFLKRGLVKTWNGRGPSPSFCPTPLLTH